MMCPIGLVALMVTHVIEPWMVVILSFIVGITDAISMPSFQTIAPTLVRRDQIATAIALNATQFNLSRILGPALAGVLMASVGAIGCFAVNAASYIPFNAMAFWILPSGVAAAAPEHGLNRHRLLLGLKRILATEHLRGGLATVLLTSMLCGPLIVFCPVLVNDIFQATASEFSLSIGAFGLGGLLGAVTLLGVEPGVDRRRLSSRMGAFYGGATMLAALNPWIAALHVVLTTAGFAMSVSNTCANAILQANVSPRLRGRTISLYMLAMRGGMSIGSLATGLSARVAWSQIRALDQWRFGFGRSPYRRTVGRMERSMCRRFHRVRVSGAHYSSSASRMDRLDPSQEAKSGLGSPAGSCEGLRPINRVPRRGPCTLWMFGSRMNETGSQAESRRARL